MSETDRYADLYLNFEDQQQWLAEAFAGMTFNEYQGFVDYCFEELDYAAETKDGAEFRLVKGLILAMARKHLETAHFMDGLTDKMRASSLATATTYYELAKSLYPAEAVPGVEAAWAASQEYAVRFGWLSPVFDILVPRHVFRQPDDRV